MAAGSGQWRQLFTCEIIEQRKPWWRRWLAKEKTEPVKFYANAYAKGPAAIIIVDRGPDKRPGVQVVPTTPHPVIVHGIELIPY